MFAPHPTPPPGEKKTKTKVWKSTVFHTFVQRSARRKVWKTFLSTLWFCVFFLQCGIAGPICNDHFKNVFIRSYTYTSSSFPLPLLYYYWILGKVWDSVPKCFGNPKRSSASKVVLLRLFFRSVFRVIFGASSRSLEQEVGGTVS